MSESQAPSYQVYKQLAQQLEQWARDFGFDQVGITDVDLKDERQALESWLEQGYHGSMEWMAEHKDKRIDPSRLVEGACRVISFRMNYLPAQTEQIKILKSPEKAYISRYALGRDYHKLVRKRLAKIAQKLEHSAAELLASFGSEPSPHINQRPFVDSAPVLERPLAQKAGLGWVGKHTLLINEQAGSWFFLGEILTNIPLPINTDAAENRCGDCKACLQVCPTDAFPSPYTLDATRCISYLTIENKGAIPDEFRQAMGNRVFGCDDCQAICPWNKYAHTTQEDDFQPRHGLGNSDLLELFLWDEDTFLKNTEGSAIRRIGYQGWLRNLAVGLGNAPSSAAIIQALQQQRQGQSSLVQEHIDWALAQQHQPQRKRQRKIKRKVKP